MINIIIAEDMPLIREGLTSLVTHEEGINLLACAEDGEAVVRLVEERQDETHVVVMDLEMPKKNGLEASKEIKARFPHIGIVILTTHKEKVYLSQALKLGIKGYILKDDVFEELLYAIREVASGQEYYGKEPTKLQREIIRDGLEKVDDLSERQIQVVYWLARGKTTEEIAKILIRSPNTIHTHRRNILQRLDLNNVAELVAWSMAKGL
ncbi:MAG: response regulator transcription factor, partial [Bacteroidota bacterium]